MQRKILILFVVIHHLSITSDAETTITSVWVNEGEKVSLPCPFSPSINGDRAVLVLWFKDSGTESIYSYDARNDDLTSGHRWYDDDILGERSFFTLTSHPPSLVLNHAKKEDHGQFTCRVEYLKSPSTFVKVNLSVIIPPEPPVILWNEKDVLGPVGPVIVGQRMELVCQTSGGRPTPIVTWWSKGDQMDSVTEANVVNGITVVRSTVVFEAYRDLHSVPIVCHAQAPNPGDVITYPRTVSTILNITLPPLSVKISGMKDPISEGTTIQPVCLSTGSHPLADMKWFKNGTEMKQATKSIMDGGNITSSSVTLHVLKEDNGAIIQCQASNTALPKEMQLTHTLTDSVELNILYKPRVLVRLGRILEASNLIEGKDAFIECVVDANPPPHRIDWFHNDKPVDPKTGLIISGPNLALQKLKKSHRGSYKCAAENLVGRNTSSTLNLNVKYSPVCAFSKDRTQGAAMGQSVKLLCMVESDPATNISFIWSKILPSGREMNLPNENISSQELTSYLSITPQHLGDFGFFLCRATNVIGTQKIPCRVTLVSAGPPEPPVNCTAGPGSESLTITCSEGFHGGFPQKFQMEAWIKGNLVSNVTREFPSWTVRNLEDGTEVNIKIRSKNAKGHSKYISFDAHMPIAHQQSVTIPEISESGLGPLVGAIIGGFAVFLILFLVAFLTICRRKRLTSERNKLRAERRSDENIIGGDCSPDVVSSVQLRGSSPGVVDVLDHSIISDSPSAEHLVHDSDNQPFSSQRPNQPEDISLSGSEERSYKAVYVASPGLQSPRSNKFYVKLYNRNTQPPCFDTKVKTEEEYRMLDKKGYPRSEEAEGISKVSSPNFEKQLQGYHIQGHSPWERGTKSCSEEQSLQSSKLHENYAGYIDDESVTKVLVEDDSSLGLTSAEKSKLESLRNKSVLLKAPKESAILEDQYSSLKRQKQLHSKSKETFCEPVIKAVTTKSTNDYRESTV